MTEVYFGETGLTSTSAAYIANKSKELFEGFAKDMENITFVNSTFKVAGTEPIVVESGKTAEWLEESINKIKLIGKLKSLNAWLREAITEKENAATRINAVSFNVWLENVKQIENRNSPQYRTVSENDIIEQMSVGDRQEYLALEAMAANIGKLIHKDGSLSKARMEIKEKIGKNDVSGIGTPSLTVVSYTSSIPIEEIDKHFLSLQEEFRSIQAKLNGYKHNITIKTNQENDRILAEYKKERAEYDSWYSVLNKEYLQYLKNATQEIVDKKIIIPESLKEIYDFVKNS